MALEENKILKLLKIDKLISHLVGYIDTKIALTKLELEERLEEIITNSFHFFLAILIGFLFILVANFGIFFYLNSILESTFLGFLIVACFYLIFLLIFIFDSNKTISKKITRLIFKHKKDNDSL